MKWYRVRALIERALSLTFRGVETLFDFFYWPLFDIVLWGFTSNWIKPLAYSNNNVSMALLSSLVIWQASYRANLDISFNLLQELWARNIVNLFATPLKLSEWMAAVMVIGIINGCISILFGTFVVWALYSINIFALGWVIIPCIAALIISGWAIGFLTASAMAYWGLQAQKLVWVMGWFFVPFTGVFYPISVLPDWAQTISNYLPMTPIFEGIRNYVSSGVFPSSYFIRSFGLGIAYVMGTMLFFKIVFELSRIKGLARLENE